MADIPDAILRGRREIEGMLGVEILRDVEASGLDSQFDLKVRLTIEQGSPAIPKATDWFVLVDEIYPYGECALYPAARESVKATFPHQSANIDDGRPWRTGRLCTDRPGRHLRGDRLVDQPTDHTRIAWHCERARQWLIAAADGTLVENGDPYEPPQHRFFRQFDLEVAFIEDEASFAAWQGTDMRSGTATMRHLNDHIWALESFRGRDSTVIAAPWGARVKASPVEGAVYWMRVADPLVVNEYAAPHTWGELRDALRTRGVDLDARLMAILEQSRGLPNLVLAIGAPIPRFVGGDDIEILWNCLLLPDTPPRTAREGFRNTAKGRFTYDKARSFRDDHLLQWLRATNVSESHAKVRGALSDALRSKRVVVVGGGALGAQVAELLVRGGVSSLDLFDREFLELGNLRRHTLTVESVGNLKAAALADRLNGISLLANVTAHAGAVPSPESTGAIERCDVVIDCTARDEVLWYLAEPVENRSARHYVSFSLGAYASRLFAYAGYSVALDYNMFHSGFDAQQDQERAILTDPQTRFVGCHNPIFPASWLDITIRAAEAVRWLDAYLQSPNQTPRFECLK